MFTSIHECHTMLPLMIKEIIVNPLSFFNSIIRFPLFSLFIGMVLFIGTAHAFEKAPPISDREIVESLALLQQNQKHLDQRITDTTNAINDRIDLLIRTMDNRFEAIDKRFEAMDKRFEAMDKRFETMDKRFEAIQNTMDKRFDAMQNTMDRRFEGMDARFQGQQDLMVVLFGSVMTLVIALMAYIMWDRKTAQEPMKKRVSTLEETMETMERHMETIQKRTLDMTNEERKNEKESQALQLTQRLIASLQEFSRTNKALADSLKSHSLL